MMSTDDMDQIISALEGFYPDKFSGMTTAQFDLWRTEFVDIPLACGLQAVRKWAMQHHHQYAPTLVSLCTVADEIQMEERKVLAQHRSPEAGGLAGVLQRTTEAYVVQAYDADTATYGRLMGALAQRSLNTTPRMSRQALAAQCRAWAQEYPQIAHQLERAAVQFASGWESGNVPMMYANAYETERV